MPDGPVKERVLKDALEIIEDNKNVIYDEIE